MDALTLAEVMKLRRDGRVEEAWARVAPLISAGNPDLLEIAGLIAADRGQKSAAVRLLERASVLNASRASIWINLSAVRAEAGDLRGAATAAQAATRLAPNQVGAWVNLGSALCAVRDFTSALEAYERAETLAPTDVEIQCDLAAAEFACGEIGRCARRLQAVTSKVPGVSRAYSLLLLALHHATNDGPGLAQAHQRFANYLPARPAAEPVVAPRQASEQRLRVGLLGGDFFRHSVWYFLSHLLEGLPALGIDLICFHTDTHVDEVTARWRAEAAEFYDVSTQAEEDIRVQVLGAHLDVIISLAGHTTSGMPSLFLQKLAPVQLSFLGYPGPLGLPTMDGWIGDSAVSPLNEPWAYPERVLRLPNSYFCFRPDCENDPSVSAAVPEHVVFGSFNTLGKISAVTVRLWSEVLRQVVGSRLVLKADSMHSPTRQRLLAEFQQQGIAPERITWLDWTASRAAHLECYRSIDIALDTFPYNGATTTCEALWMGVPVVSLSGNTPASRMGRSILHAAGCREWVSDDSAQFTDIARRLAEEFTSLRASRTQLRERISLSPLMQGARHCRDFADLLRAAVTGRKS
jgi:predicted O-linked N-acetylglucosamine transferase (SPINDLY family)